MLALIFLMFTLLTACGGSKEEASSAEVQTETGDSSNLLTEVEDADAEEETILFETDEIVNDLLVQYNGIAEYPIPEESISKGNVRTKAIITLENLYIEVINSTRGFVDISITDDGETEEALYPIFRDFLTAMDSTLSADEIATSWEDIQSGFYEIDYNGTGTLNTYELGNTQLQYIESDLSSHKISVNMCYAIS